MGLIEHTLRGALRRFLRALRRFLRAPIPLYRAGFGALPGNRLLYLVHIGRTSELRAARWC